MPYSWRLANESARLRMVRILRLVIEYGLMAESVKPKPVEPWIMPWVTPYTVQQEQQEHCSRRSISLRCYKRQCIKTIFLPWP